MNDVATIIRTAWQTGQVVPAFNIPYLPVMEPVVQALREADCVGLIAVARLEWEKFGAVGLQAIRDEYERVADPRLTRLHLDHVPVIDEDGQRVDYEAILGEAVELGYDSVMVDASRLPLDENIAAVRGITEMAHPAGVPVEAELGAILGHETGPLPPYDELFASGRGFTDPDEAKRFVAETGVDWLSVAVGSVHGAISATRKNEPKIRARLDIDHLERIRRAVDAPLVLHGGTGIPSAIVRDAVHHGIAKINIATAIRQPYEAAVSDSVVAAQDAVRRATLAVIRSDLGIENSAHSLLAETEP